MLRFKSLFSRLLSLGVVLLSSVLVTASPATVGAQAPSQADNVNATLAAIGTAFSYQGRLTDSGAPANSMYDFVFALYDAETGGLQVDTNREFHDVQVKDGFFTVQPDFGNVFDGNTRYLEIGVRPSTSDGTHTLLIPRRAVTAAPYALAMPGMQTTANGPLVTGNELRVQQNGKNIVMSVGGTAVDLYSATNSLFIQSRGTGPCPWSCNNVLINPWPENGNVGIGTANPGTTLEVRSPINSQAAIRFGDPKGYAELAAGSDGIIILDKNNNPRLVIDQNTSKVSINGDLYVNNTLMNVPDYVFEEGYNLMSLDELAAYIAKEKHLPGVPSQADIKRDGLNLSQFHMNLLEKTEELTLYTLAQQEQIDAQQQQIIVLQQSIANLEARLATLEQK